MTKHTQPLLWAGGILATAWISQAIGMSDTASFGIIAALSATAVAAIHGRRGKGCA